MSQEALRSYIAEQIADAKAQRLLLSVAEEQADGSVIYSDAIVDAGSSLLPLFNLPLFKLCCA